MIEVAISDAREQVPLIREEWGNKFPHSKLPLYSISNCLEMASSEIATTAKRARMQELSQEITESMQALDSVFNKMPVA